MSGGGINLEEQKRPQQYIQMRAEQQISSQQKLDYDSYRNKKKNPKDAIVTVCVVAGLVLILFLLARNGII